MSNNAIRQLRKAIRLKFKSTIPNIGMFHNDTVRIWVPYKDFADKRSTLYRTRAYVAKNLSKCILASGIPYLNKENNFQPCYFIIEKKYLEPLTGWILLYRGNQHD